MQKIIFFVFNLFLFSICDLRIFTSLCKQKKIIITDEVLRDATGNFISSKIEKGIMYCSLRKNSESKDSRFITIDVKMANDFYEGLIIAQKGYF